MLPDADTDLEQLAILATVLRFKSLTNLDHYVHSALAADIHSWLLAAVVSQAVCDKAWEFSCIIWWSGFCCWKIRNPNHQPMIMKWKPRLLFLMQVHRNKPKGLFYESCSNVTARNIWNWKYSKVTTAEAFQSQSCCNSQLEWFSITCSQTLEAVITNWHNSSNVKPDCSV